MDPDRPKATYLEKLIGEKMIEKLNHWDWQVRQYYIKLDDPNLKLFDQLLHLHSQLILAIGKNVPGFRPKFYRSSPVQHVLRLSAVGAFRALRVAHKLLLEAYHLEMQGTLRMVEQWCEVAIIVEGSPDTATKILKNGVSKKDREKASKSSMEIKNEIKAMRKTFHWTSQRVHVLPAAIHLSGQKDKLFLTGAMDEELFHKDSLALAKIASNALSILIPHFQEVPLNWYKKFEVIVKQLMAQSS